MHTSFREGDYVVHDMHTGAVRVVCSCAHEKPLRITQRIIKTVCTSVCARYSCVAPIQVSSLHCAAASRARHPADLDLRLPCRVCSCRPASIGGSIENVRALSHMFVESNRQHDENN